jgi:hypothetical protein
MDFKIGQRVSFGRGNGERTLGEIVKINPTKAKVKQLESRGRLATHPIGTIWTVPFSLIYPVINGACGACDCADPTCVVGLAQDCDCACHKPHAPTGDAAMSAEIARLRAENEKLRQQAAQAAQPKRSDAEILREILGLYSALEPEVLSADGERSRSECRRIAANIHRRLRECFIEIGRDVSEDEAYKSLQAA